MKQEKKKGQEFSEFVEAVTNKGDLLFAIYQPKGSNDFSVVYRGYKEDLGTAFTLLFHNVCQNAPHDKGASGIANAIFNGICNVMSNSDESAVFMSTIVRRVVQKALERQERMSLGEDFDEEECMGCDDYNKCKASKEAQSILDFVKKHSKTKNRRKKNNKKKND